MKELNEKFEQIIFSLVSLALYPLFTLSSFPSSLCTCWQTDGALRRERCQDVRRCCFLRHVRQNTVIYLCERDDVIIHYVLGISFKKNSLGTAELGEIRPILAEKMLKTFSIILFIH